MYGSSFTMVTRRPRASRSAPIDALARPFPIDDTTPPVTKTYLVGLRLIGPALSIAREETQGLPVEEEKRRAHDFCPTRAFTVGRTFFPAGFLDASWSPGSSSSWRSPSLCPAAL